MKKKFGLLVALTFATLAVSGMNASAEEVGTSNQRSSFQPYFTGSDIYKDIKPFETVEFAIPKLPVISGYHVNVKFYAKPTSNSSENFLVEQISPDGNCVLASEVVAGYNSNLFYKSTAGAGYFGTNFRIARITNLSLQPMNYTIQYNYKLSTDPNDFAGL
ncbi:hypothetical protein ACWOC1_01495 [Enterococcus quebecensis]|uniref:Uncharacterized protein n=1 Tax=Enterococcus quebecensis TaxID=903983 RepID=A0A1E5H3L0_9ENTE|nr:hypothetical protein [Enterococcus quebecensis]OEG19501.1 hypothetical protein BCR23_02085 [Enterococcus quebecensis]OJG75223.1 hypothetical protein RV12_GL001828 [Enterococcus quebecensis]